MFTSRFLAVAVAALANISFVSAAPTAERDILVKRNTEDTVLSTLNSLNNALTLPISQINTAVANNDVSMATIGPPCDSIIALLTGANGQLAGLLPGSWDGHGPMPPVYTDCVNILVLILTALVPCLGQLVPFITFVPQLVLCLIQVDLCLCTLLTAIGLLLFGVVLMVGSLCVNLLPTMQFLAFNLTIGCLGLL